MDPTQPLAETPKDSLLDIVMDFIEALLAWEA